MASKASPATTTDRMVRIKNELERIATVQLPEILEPKLDLGAWARALYLNNDYEEKDPDYMARELLIQTLLAGSPEALYEQTGLPGLQELIPDIEDAYIGPLDIIDLYVAKSDLTDGAKCYMILTMFDLDTGREIRGSTGATQLQAQVLGHISYGTWPVRGRIQRLPSKDKGGRHLLYFAPPEGFGTGGNTSGKPGF